MENKQVTLTNTIKSRVGINIPELLLKRTWEKKGVKRNIDMNTLREAFYYPSVEYLLREGILYIDDMDVKIELGLEEPESTVPTAIVILSENDMQRYMTTLPIYEFKEKVKSLGKEQVQALVDYAIENKLTSFDKCEFLKGLTQTDILSAVQLQKANEEG
jgi:hypothetical protein